MEEKDYRMYILVNDDIKIGKGKLAGQVGHAVASYFYRTIEDVLFYPSDDPIIESDLTMLDDYMKVQKKIILKCPQSKLEELEQKGFITIRDKGWTQLEPNTLTCVNVGIIDKSDVPEWINNLKLM